MGLDGAGRMPPRLWSGLYRAAPPYRGLRGPPISRRFTGRTANGATDAFQIYRQPEDGRRPGPLSPSIDPRPRRRGHRMRPLAPSAVAHLEGGDEGGLRDLDLAELAHP